MHEGWIKGKKIVILSRIDNAYYYDIHVGRPDRHAHEHHEAFNNNNIIVFNPRVQYPTPITAYLPEYVASPTNGCAVSLLSQHLLTLFGDDGRDAESFLDGPSPEPVLERREGGEGAPVLGRGLL